MIERLHAPAPHVVALRAGGRITSEDVGRATAALDDALAAHDRVSFFLVLDGLGWVEPAALLRDLRYGIGQLGNLHRFHRAAVVTSMGWVRAVVGAEDALLPGLDVRAFAPSERAEAERWVAEAPPPAGPGLRPLPGRRPSAVAVEVTGTVRAEDVDALAERVVAAGDAVDLFVQFRPGAAVGLSTLGGALDRDRLRAAGRVRRCAVVGGPGWLAAASGLLDPLSGARVRHFEAGEDAAAWAWLDAGRDAEPAEPLALPATVADLPASDPAGSERGPDADPPADDLGSAPPAGTPPPL